MPVRNTRDHPFPVNLEPGAVVLNAKEYDRLMQSAVYLAWELTGTVSAYQEIYAQYPDLPSPAEIENYMWHLYASATPLQDALEAVGVDWRGMGLARDEAQRAKAR